MPGQACTAWIAFFNGWLHATLWYMWGVAKFCSPHLMECIIYLYFGFISEDIGNVAQTVV
jgi:hypothetical protein